MAETSIAGATTALRNAQSTFVLCVFTLLSAVFLQKIALPGTGGIYPLNLLIFPAVATASFLAGVIEINTTAFIWYALFALVGTLSAALSSSPHVSVLSLGFLVVAQFPLVFRCVQPNICYRRVMNFLSTVGCISALVGVFQFMGQFVVGVDIAFFLDKHLPVGVTVTG